jgi:hypothetical protein
MQEAFLTLMFVAIVICLAAKKAVNVFGTSGLKSLFEAATKKK